MIKLCGFLFIPFLFSIAIAQTPSSAKAKPKQPNIIFIIADDLGYGDIEPYGQKLIKTPFLAAMAKQGMLFTQFYSGTSVCAPSRCALMTGKHTGHTFIRGNKEIQPEGQYPIPDTTFTIAEAFKNAGYTTGLFGKWGLGPMGSSGDPMKHGIDRFYGYNCQRQSHRYYPDHLWDNEKKIALEANGALRYTKTYAPDLIQQQALSFIKENTKQPFLLFLTYTLPHAELLVPDDSLYQQYKGKFVETPSQGNDYGRNALVAGYASQAFPHATFAAMVSRLDKYVGEVMAQLKQSGIDENTLVIFTSDNGPHIEGGADPVFFNSAGGLRGVKRDLYEGGIRVPFIARWPGKIKAGTKSNYISALWDMFPTFAQIAALPAPANTDGISMLPIFTAAKVQPKHDWLYWEFHEDGGRQAVRKGKWKAVRYNVKDSSSTVELYDLDVDRAEANNIAEKYPEIVRQLTVIMNEAHKPSAIFPFGKE
ncbi:MAG: arylsulfatase [Agriterribacter sp.]